ncbi:MAG TPA: hypothetical protein VK631_12885, partial [Solirubrobacteraceae bacterium]|nr:hypothetical protein [Solirubrobacteraceae bacterium]
MRTLLQTSAGRAAAALSVLLVVGTAIGLIVLWPTGEHKTQQPIAIGDVVRADVTRVSSEDCESWAGPGCRLFEIQLRSGPSAGRRSYLTLPTDRFAPPVKAGDHIRVARNVPSGLDAALVERLPVDDPSQQPFAFIDFERSSPLLWLVLAFVALVVLLGRWHGVRALLGLGISLVIVVEFLAPS